MPGPKAPGLGEFECTTIDFIRLVYYESVVDSNIRYVILTEASCYFASKTFPDSLDSMIRTFAIATCRCYSSCSLPEFLLSHNGASVEICLKVSKTPGVTFEMDLCNKF